MRSPPIVLTISGEQGGGKTTLINQLVPFLVEKGYRVVVDSDHEVVVHNEDGRSTEVIEGNQL
jgi:molybdopterin-guanine dinucleotide biosynthesis protein